MQLVRLHITMDMSLRNRLYIGNPSKQTANPQNLQVPRRYFLPILQGTKEKKDPFRGSIKADKLQIAHNMQSVLAGNLLKKLRGTEGSL